MKRISAVVFMLIMPSLLFAAFGGVWRSSHTATADTTKNLCMDRRGFFHGVIVSSPSLAAASVQVFASSASAVNTLALINATGASSQGQYFYDVGVSTPTGLTYSTIGTAQIDILYECY